MVNLSQIEENIKVALKSRDQLAADTLRGLKVRIQNEQIAKMSRGAASGSDAKIELTEEEIVTLVQSEVKRRKEAAKSFAGAGRQESAEKEMKEASILEKYLPAQLSEPALVEIIEQTVASLTATPEDFGKVMAEVKAKVGQQADGATLARLVKEKLK